MPPKKKAPEEPKMVLLGRPGNNLKMGIVGLPNVGKSTFFNTMSKLNVAAENFPFCTIEPNVAKVPVPDERFDWLCQAFKPKNEVAAVLTVTDIAGLVKGASEGAGLGNAFLSHIAAVDGIFHMVRAFGNGDEVTHVEGNVDPVRDLDIIHRELLLKDIQQFKNAADGMKKNVERGVGGKEKKFEYDTVCKVLEHLEAGHDVKMGKWSAQEVEILNIYQPLTAKPMVYLVNLSEKHFIRKGNKWLPKLAEWLKARGTGEKMIPFSADFEQKLVDKTPEEAAAYQTETKCRSMLAKIIRSGYSTLQLINFFTVGPDEVRAWTVKRGSSAPKAAGTIHTDFEKGFICADTYHFDDLKEHETELGVKSAGRLRMEGRKYEVIDGDIMHFKFNVSGSKK